MSFTVALDGPAAAGKGTIARAIAAHFEFSYLDTGLLYRAVGAKTLQGHEAITAAQNLTEADIIAPGLRHSDVAMAASKVAAMPEVRAALFDFQVAFARRAGGAVLDGRDIGTVICPEAEVKLFVTAAQKTRAQRRLQEILARGDAATFETVYADLSARDKRDQGRIDAPLRPADDAISFDTTQMSIDDAIASALQHVKARYDQLSQ